MNKITFKDSDGNYLFSIDDGSYIVIKPFDKYPITAKCGYIDTESFRFDKVIFSYEAFSSMIENNGCIFYPQNGKVKTYEIYQIQNILVDYKFMSYSIAKMMIDANDYKKVYCGMMAEQISLEDIYIKHNKDDRPFGDKIHSLSLSDVIVINEKGKKRAFYIDTVGFKEIPQFIQQLNRSKEVGR